MNIGLDIMGGDYAPEEALKGVWNYLEKNKQQNVHFFLFGDQNAVENNIALKAYAHQITSVHSDVVIGMQEHPTKALKEKSTSSISLGMHYLKEKKIDVFLSAGNTGAMMIGAMYSVKPIEGIARPTIASPIPNAKGGYNFLLDVGANADCKPEHLAQFAVMGSLYAKDVLNIENPRVGLLNIGEEEGKGNILAQATFPLLKTNPNINFIGNIEGRDIFLDRADVIVCEGFVGNVALKMAESIFNIFSEEKGLKDPLLEQFNFEIYGGTPILGINAPVIIGHGISKGLAFQNMIKTAIKILESKLTDKIIQHFKEA